MFMSSHLALSNNLLQHQTSGDGFNCQLIVLTSILSLLNLNLTVLIKNTVTWFLFFAVFFSFPIVLKLSQPTFIVLVILPMNSQEQLTNTRILQCTFLSNLFWVLSLYIVCKQCLVFFVLLLFVSCFSGPNFIELLSTKIC